ncbi:MAG: hypothetical protein ABFR95_02615 [Actinomycetota bacterium]
MNDIPNDEEAPQDRPALEALATADPADAPDIAEGVAASLQRELDQTDASRETKTESAS